METKSDPLPGEINFIVTERDRPLPIDVKLNFAQCLQIALTYFSNHYESEPYRVGSLNGSKPEGHGAWP